MADWGVRCVVQSCKLGARDSESQRWQQPGWHLIESNGRHTAEWLAVKWRWLAVESECQQPLPLTLPHQAPTLLATLSVSGISIPTRFYPGQDGGGILIPDDKWRWDTCPGQKMALAGVGK